MIERINPLKKAGKSAEIAGQTETALSSHELSGMKLVPVVVGEIGGPEIEALVDLQNRIVVPLNK